MPFDKLKYPEELWKERRKGVQESLATISIDELKKIVKEHEEEFVDDPWRDEFLRVIWSIERTILGVAAGTGVIATDNEVIGSVVAANDRVPQCLTWSSHAHCEWKQC